MSDDEKAIKSMLLPLAERMVSKYVKDKKVDAEAGKDSSIKFILITCNVNYLLHLVLFNMLLSSHQPAINICCCQLCKITIARFLMTNYSQEKGMYFIHLF